MPDRNYQEFSPPLYLKNKMGPAGFEPATSAV
jgi:hypothetical protein